MQASTDFKWYLLTLISFIGTTFCCSLLFIIWVLAMAFTTDSNNGEKKFTHPILTAVQFFLVTAFITLSNVLALEFFYGADAKMRAFCNRARPEKRSTQLLKTVVSIIFIICLYMGARRVVHSLFSDVVYSSSKSGHVHYYLPNPVEHFWQALTTYLFYFTPTVLILNSLMGLDQNVNAVVPYSLKFINSMMVLFGKISLFGWSLACIFAIVLNSPFYNAVPMVALLMTLIELSVWCEISSMRKLTPYQRLMSFLEFLKQVMIFLTRLSQVVYVGILTTRWLRRHSEAPYLPSAAVSLWKLRFYWQSVPLWVLLPQGGGGGATAKNMDTILPCGSFPNHSCPSHCISHHLGLHPDRTTRITYHRNAIHARKISASDIFRVESPRVLGRRAVNENESCCCSKSLG